MAEKRSLKRQKATIYNSKIREEFATVNMNI